MNLCPIHLSLVSLIAAEWLYLARHSNRTGAYILISCAGTRVAANAHRCTLGITSGLQRYERFKPDETHSCHSSIKRRVTVADPALLILWCTLGIPSGSPNFNFLIAPRRLDAIWTLIRAGHDTSLVLSTMSLSSFFFYFIFVLVMYIVYLKISLDSYIISDIFNYHDN